MNFKNKSSQDFSAYQLRLLNFWVNAIAIGSVLLILVATLSPFDFQPANLSWVEIISNFAAPSNLGDVVGNVVMFIPFGFGWTSWLKRRKLSLITSIVLAWLVSTAFSLTVEILQIFLPSRNPDYTDLLTNSTGGLLGAIVYFVWSVNQGSTRLIELVRKIKSRLWRPILAAALIIWVVFTGLTALNLQKAAYLSNWNTKFPLLLGNETTGDRPWQGTISHLAIADRAFSELEIAKLFTNQSFPASPSLIANYSFTGQNHYQDRTQQLPDLVWQGNPIQNQPNQGVSLSQDYWLSTATAATTLSEKLRRSSHFTISTIISTANFQQQGPSRIISLSNGAFRRNFTVGQEKTELIFRLRTPITGTNGPYTGLSVPNFFQDNQPHHLIFTYSPSILKLYVDRLEDSYSLELTPEITLFRYLLPFEGSSMHLTPIGILINQLMYYSLFFAPLGILTALITTLFPRKSSFPILLYVGGIIVPALILELLIQVESNLRIDNLIISIAIATIAMVVVQINLRSLYRSE